MSIDTTKASSAQRVLVEGPWEFKREKRPEKRGKGEGPGLLNQPVIGSKSCEAYAFIPNPSVYLATL